MTDRMDWEGRVGRSWADQWRRTDRSFGGLTDRLLGAAAARPIGKALDVGCGAGEVSLAIARGHPGAEVLGIDVSPQLLDVARERSGHLGNVSFEHADASTWSREGFAPDLIVSRHGVMFFPDPVAAFAHLRRIAAPGARLAFTCFRDIAENPWAERVTALLPPGTVEPPSPVRPGPFAFADKVQVEGILAEAGWNDVLINPIDYAFIAGTGDDAIEDALGYFLAIGPAARAASQLDDNARAQFIAKLRRFLANHAEGKLVALKASAWLATARTPAA